MEMRKKLAEFLILLMTHIRSAYTVDAQGGPNRADLVDLPALDDGLVELLGAGAMEELSYGLELNHSTSDTFRVLNDRNLRIINTSKVQQAIEGT